MPQRCACTTAGIDPILRRRFWEHFRTLRGQGRTLLVTTQYIGEAAYCDLVGIMSQGRLLYLDTPDTLRRLALNGEVVRIIVAPEQAAAALDLLREPPARLVRPGPPHEPGVLYVHVDDAGAAIPLLVQRISRLVRKTLSFSKKVENHIGAIWYVVHHWNASLA